MDGEPARRRRAAALTIPGTHDSGAIHEPGRRHREDPDLTFAEQLDAGIRYFDVRCRDFDNQFLIYHGSIDQNQTFDDVLAAMYAFLEAHPQEALIISVKEELEPQGGTLAFDAAVRSIRGAAIRRGGTSTTDPHARRGARQARPAPPVRRDRLSLGIDAAPGVWTDNATFDIAGPPVLHVEDNYIVTDDALKWTAITSLFGEATSLNDPAALYLAYTSGYQMISGLPNIPSV